MKQILLYFSVLTGVVAFGTQTVAQPALGGAAPVITEIMYNPPEAGTDSLEFIEILNPSLTATINMSGFYIEDAFSFTFPSGFILGTGEYVVIAGDSVIFESAFGVEALQWEGSANQLSNNGESITLKAPNSTVVDEVTYGASGMWPAGANSQGYSLVLCDPTADNSLAANWTISENNTGVVVNSLTVYADPGMAATCTATGIADDNVITTLVYPNPTEGLFTMQFAELKNMGTLSIHNSVGQLIQMETIAAGTTTKRVDSQLASGFYVITLQDGDAISHQNLIVQ